MSKCKHEQFQVLANVNRFEDSGGFSVDLTVICAQCNEPFRFIGLECGLSMEKPMCSFDALEARFPIAPKDQVQSIGDGAIGFTIRRVK